MGRMRSAKTTVFAYAYIPSRPSGPNDGGFCVNLTDQNTLSFSTYNTQNTPLATYEFTVPPTLLMTYQQIVKSAGGWLRSIPVSLHAGPGIRYSARIGLDGYPLFLMDDFALLMNCPFKSMRGHYARMMYNLLEDIATEFMRVGIDFRPDAFTWDPSRIQPVQQERKTGTA